MTGSAKGALDGIRVLDLTTIVLGPWAAQNLGDMGADVIKIEAPQGDSTRSSSPRRHDGMGALFMGANRNKRSLVLDLKNDRARDALGRLVASADVVLHNVRPKAAEKLGITYRHLSKFNPKLIVCTAAGFRQDGPMADNPAYDDIIQAASGIASLLSIPAGEPRYVPTIVADKISGMAVVSAILAALFHRERTGVGQSVEVPMFEALVDFVMVEQLGGANFVPPAGSMGYGRANSKMRRPYRTKDNGYIGVLPYTDKNWQELFRIAGRNDLLKNPIFSNHAVRIANAEEVYQILADIIATRTLAEWDAELTAAQVPAQRILSPEDLLDHPQLAATSFWHTADHPTEGTIRLPDPPVRFSRSPSSIRRLQPRLGEHSREILAETGYSETEIDQLFAEKVSSEN